MAKHNDFIFSSIEHVLEEGINALSSISDGIETYPLNEYIMKSVFLKMTGFQEQKFKCIAWELATEDYEFRRIFLNDFAKEGFSTYDSKQKLYKSLMGILERSEFSEEVRKTIVDESIKCIVKLIDDSTVKYWNEYKYNDFKQQIKSIVSYKNIARRLENKNKAVYNLLENNTQIIYEKLYRSRNRLAHNTVSYQQNLPVFEEMEMEEFGFNNYFVWFYLLIVIDKIMVKLYKEFCDSRAIFGDDVFKQSNKDIIEDIIYWSTIYNGDRKIIREKIEGKYPNTFNKKQLNKILGFKFEGWGNLSKKFLELQGTSKVNGEIDSVIGFMWNKQENLMELLSDNYTFTSQLNGMMNDTIKPLSSWKIEDLEDMYLSPSVKRMVWQTMKIVDELQSVIGYAPKRVFVEVTRGDGEKKRTTSRKQKLIDLYKSIKGEAKDWIKEIENRDESAFKSRKLFLYYMQQGMCMYSGEKIDLDNLMNDNLYDLDHIYPQHFTKDDSIHNNLVLVKKEFNARKSDMPITKEIQAKMHGKWKALLDGKFITSEKYARLTRHSYAFSDDEKAGFINRQLVETSQATKAITKIFSQAFDNNTKIVFSKARLVSDFRQKFELPKSRVLNCYHHANDAYLNIVVGNSYYVKFEGNPARFIKESKGKEEEKKYKYHLSKFFENTVQNKNEVAWSVEEGNNTITTVKRTMAKYSPLVTYKTEEGKGEYFKETIYPKSKAKPIVYTGLKSKNTPLNDVKKYGGKTAIGTSGYCFVKYTEKNKEVRKFETLPIYLGSSRTLTVERIQEYLKESYLEKGMIQAAETVEVLIKFVPQKTELVLDGHTYTIGGSTGDMMYINGIVQVKLSKELCKVFSKIRESKRDK